MIRILHGLFTDILQIYVVYILPILSGHFPASMETLDGTA